MSGSCILGLMNTSASLLNALAPRGHLRASINLGNPNEFTMLQLAEAVQRLVGSSLPLRFEPLPTDDPKQRRPDIAKAQRLLGGWEPKVQLAEGLARTLAYFRNQP